MRQTRSLAPRIGTFLPAIVLAGAMTAACGGTPTGPNAASALDNPGRVLTVMTFNIQHGLDFNGKYNLQNAVDTIAAVGPDLVAVQELTRNHPSYNCDDQPAFIARGLQQATGRSWRQVYQQQWFTPDHSCADRGTGDGPETEGLGLFASQSINGVTTIPLWDSSAGLAGQSGPTGVPVATTHLASGTGLVSDRTRQIAQLLPWTQGLGVPRVLVGDFNARPGDPELQPVVAQYRDAWADAVAAGTAQGAASGDTRIRGGRIDYVFYAGDQLKVLSAQVVDTLASDHRPLVVRFSVR